MAHVITFFPEEGFIELRFTESLTCRAAKDAIDAVSECIQKTNCQRVLTNSLKVRYELSTLDYFELARYTVSVAKKRQLNIWSIRRAHVGDVNKTDLLFFENVLVNRGQNMKVFTDMDAAKKWLLE